MPDIDNHMDELFQKSADNYPLKTGKGNFDDLMPFIAAETTTITKPGILSGKRKTALMLLALLFTCALTGTYIINNSRNDKTAADKILLKDRSTVSTQQNNITAQINVNNDVAVIGNESAENTVKASETVFAKNRQGYNAMGKMFTDIIQSDAVTDDVKVKENSNTIDKREPINKTETEDKSEKGTAKISTETKKENIDQSAKKNEPEKEEQKPAVKKNKSKPGFYYGIAAGAEFNKVKNQGVTKAGFNGGVILGLQMNKKLAVETGVQLSQKKYYSDGKYFKPKTGAMPVNMTVSSLQSTSILIEIPVSVKYNFSKKKNTLYGKAGVSSYIMTKESNSYQAVVSGQRQEVNSTYKNTHGYLASDIRVSAGYQHTLSPKLNMRIEPYIQIPLKGIGIGALPVAASGLQIVLTRN